MKLFKGRQDTLSLLPGISIYWDRNYKSGGFYTFCVSFDWIFWFIGVDFIDWEDDENEELLIPDVFEDENFDENE